ELRKERFELLVGNHFHLVHDWNERLIQYAFFAELQRRHHAVQESGGHAIGQGMIGGFFGIRPILVRIAKNVGGARDHLHLDFLHIVGLDLLFFDRLHHGGEWRVTKRLDWKALHAAIKNTVVRLG